MARPVLIFLILALSLVLAACGDSSATPANQAGASAQPAAKPTPTPPPGSTTPPARTKSQDEDDIREAILRNQFAYVAGNPGYPASQYYCLGFETTRQSASNLQDPPQALLDRFKGNNPPVVKASECAMTQDKAELNKVVLKSSGEPAMFWGIGSITWSGDNKAELEISSLYAINGTGGTVFQLERENGSWKVTGSTLTWIA